VVDLVYAAKPTPLVAWAARGGSRTVDGLEVLVRQGALSFERWTGVEAPIDAMRAAAASSPAWTDRNTP
jgi:shikimate dehydrogenase